MKVRKSDTVKIISGKDRGREGKVISVLKDKEKVVVEKINIIKKHQKKTGNKKDPGGIIEIESPLHISKVMVVCPTCNKPTRIGFQEKEGKKRRICKKCKTIIE